MLVFAFLVVWPGRSFAQVVETGSAPAVLGTQQNEGVGGVKVGESTYLRANVAAEAGYDSNVFYNDENRVESATLRITPAFELTNSTRENARPPLHFSLGAQLLYREYLTDSPDVRAQRAFNPVIIGLLSYAGAKSSVTFSDQFMRVEDPPYEQGGNSLIRDLNQAMAELAMAPGGGRLRFTLRYVNTLDVFENPELDYADRLRHEGVIDAAWSWFPKTALFLQLGAGYTDYLNNNEAQTLGKQNSVPYYAQAGLRGLITPKLSASLGAGYADAIYDGDGVDPNGLSNLLVSASLTYSPVSLTQLGLSYSHEFRDSPVLGNYYDLDAVGLSLAQQVGPFSLGAKSTYELRRYRGFQAGQPVSRTDHVFVTSVQADYFLQKWLYAGVGYAHQISRSSIGDTTVNATTPSVDFTKHLILGRLGVTY